MKAKLVEYFAQPNTPCADSPVGIRMLGIFRKHPEMSFEEARVAAGGLSIDAAAALPKEAESWTPQEEAKIVKLSEGLLAEYLASPFRDQDAPMPNLKTFRKEAIRAMQRLKHAGKWIPTDEPEQAAEEERPVFRPGRPRKYKSENAVRRGAARRAREYRQRQKERP